MAVGRKTDVQMIGQEQVGAAVAVEDAAGDDDVDPLDFGMM
jgi:hypothetical protein